MSGLLNIPIIPHVEWGQEIKDGEESTCHDNTWLLILALKTFEMQGSTLVNLSSSALHKREGARKLHIVINAPQILAIYHPKVPYDIHSRSAFASEFIASGPLRD